MTGFSLKPNGSIVNQRFTISMLLCFGAFMMLITPHSCSGQHLSWVRTLGGTPASILEPSVEIKSIAVDTQGSLYATGTFSDTVDFNPGIDTLSFGTNGLESTRDGFVMKLTSDGILSWAIHIPSNPGYIRVHGIAVDDSSYVYITGTFASSVDFNPDTINYFLTSNGQRDAFIAKYDSLGRFKWARNVGASVNNNSGDGGTDIVVDSWGNVIFSGYFNNVADFDPGPGTYTIAADQFDQAFICKFDRHGNFLWAGGIGGPVSDRAQSLDVDENGSVYVSGYFYGLADMDPGPGIYTLDSGSNFTQNIFVLKLDSLGVFRWAHRVSSQFGVGDAISVYASSVYVGGHYFSTTNFNPDGEGFLLTPNGDRDLFFMKLDTSGTFRWARGIGGPSDDRCTSLVVDSAEDIYIGGHFAGECDFDPSSASTILTGDTRDGYVAAFDSSGTFKWAYSTLAEVNAVCIDDSRFVYSGGFFDGTVDFDPGPTVHEVSGSGHGFIQRVVQCDDCDTKLEFINIYDSNFILINTSYTNNSNPTKICSDGTRSTLLRFICDTCNMENIRLIISNDSVVQDTVELGGASYPSDYNLSGSGDTLNIIFKHPEFIGYNYAPYRSDNLILFDILMQDTIFQSPLEIYRTPVLFVHGLAAGPSTFDYMAEVFLASEQYPHDTNQTDGAALLRQVDYRARNTERFTVNKRVVPNSIRLLLKEAIQEGYSCGSSVVVGHSMGGLLARLYLQSIEGVSYNNDIQKLITINTPHYGTQLANHVVTNGIATPAIIELWAGDGASDGAIRDLQVNSFPIRRKINIDQVYQQKVPSVTLSTDQIGDENVWVERLILNPLINGSNPIFDGDQSDLIVPIGSQRSSITSEAPILGQAHMGASAHPSIVQHVAALIDTDPASPAFEHNGFPPGQLVYATPQVSEISSDLDRSASTDSVQIISPIAGQVFLPSETVTVVIHATPGIANLALIITGPSITPMALDTTNVDTLQFQVPSSAIGTLNLYLLGGDGIDWTASDESYIMINSSAVPDSIECSPDQVDLPLGLSQYVEVSGFFGGSPVTLNGAPNLSAQLDPTFIEDEGGSVFQAIAVGATFLVFEYMGLTDTVFITVEDDPSALVSAFDYSDETLCQGETVSFSDLSQGLVTGLQWNFPGGSPNSSTDANPVVNYSNPGVYDVSLITTFVNGSDTLIFDSLVEVLAIDTSVTLNDGTLLAGAVDATYQWLDCSDGFSAIPSATDSAFTPTTNGLYALAVTQGVCIDTSACYLVLTTGVDSYAAQGASIFPNPNDGTFVLELAESNLTVLVEITDMTGRVVHREQARNARRLHIQLEGAVGCYLINVTTPQKRFVVPLVKR